MNIVEVFSSKVKSMFDEDQQTLNECLIEIATFFYKVDQRISLEEQKYMQELMDSINWTSSVSVEAYQRGCIARVNNKLSGSEESIVDYLSKLMETLASVDGVEKAKAIAKEIADADGEIADDEVRFLEIVSAY